MEKNLQPAHQKPVNEQSISSRIRIKDDSTITYIKAGHGEINTDRPLGAVRLELALDDSGLTQYDLADLANVKQGTISRIISGVTKKSRHLPDIAQALKINVEWLSGFDQKDDFVKLDNNSLRINNEEFILIRMYEESHQLNAAKEKKYMGKDSTTMIAAKLLDQGIDPADLNFIYEYDRANMPDIRPGAAITFNTKDNVVTTKTNGDFFVIQHDQQGATVRRLFLEPNGSIRLKAKEIDYPEYVMKLDEPGFKILGRVAFITNSY